MIGVSDDNKKNILFISHCLPYPPDDGNKLRAYYALNEMRKHGNSITLCCFTMKEDNKYIKNLQGKWKDVKVVPFEFRKKLNFYIYAFILTIFTKYPFSVSYYQDRLFKKGLRRLVANNKYDLVYVFGPMMSQYALDINLPKILDTIDCQSNLHHSGFITSTKLHHKIYWLLNYYKWKTYEKKVFHLFDYVITTADREKEILDRVVPSGIIKRLLNGVDTQFFKPSKNNIEPYSMVFFGNMGYSANQDAVVFFLQEVFPIVKQKVPQSKIYIIGKDCPKYIANMHDDKNIFIIGYVDDIRPYIEQAEIVISPLKMAVGIQNKILVAMSMNKPIVATTASIGDISSYLEKDDIAVADSKEDFAEAILKIFSGELTVGSNGRNIVEKHFSWDAFGKRQEEIMNSLVR